jgi:hypothetical protein
MQAINNPGLPFDSEDVIDTFSRHVDELVLNCIPLLRTPLLRMYSTLIFTHEKQLEFPKF